MEDRRQTPQNISICFRTQRGEVMSKSRSLIPLLVQTFSLEDESVRGRAILLINKHVWLKNCQTAGRMNCPKDIVVGLRGSGLRVLGGHAPHPAAVNGYSWTNCHGVNGSINVELLLHQDDQLIRPADKTV